MNSSVIAHQSLTIALFFALLIHAVMLFSIHLPKTEPRSFARDIDVVIVDSATDKATQDKHFLAQHNQQGAAQDTHKAQNLARITPQKALKPLKPAPQLKDLKPQPTIKPISDTKPTPVKPVKDISKPVVENKHIIKTPPPVKETPRETQRIIKPPTEDLKPVQPKPEPLKALEPKPEPVVENIKPILTKESTAKTVLKPIEPEKIANVNKAINDMMKVEDVKPVKEIKKSVKQPEPERKPKPSTNPFSPTSLADQISQYGSQVQQDAIQNQTRIKTVNQVTANKYIAAQYLKDWESKVERNGNLNYPAEAMKAGFSATLVMEVHINMDGSIAQMIITRSSGNSALDEAAKKIVSMSAPFPPLPDALRSELEILKIIRVWKFSDESGLITQ